MEQALSILKKFWGYEDFRPAQRKIIQSVLLNRDTLALLPTGGGKSICFQVPAMIKEGLCIVVTPLIALMKDQTEQLRKRNIPALAIHSSMSYQEIDILLDRCVYDSIKFLYISPERIKTDIFRVRVQKMKVNLIAVDEAHCISQWGFDFRPSYLEIVSLRQMLPSVPIIALTATATSEVIKDIEIQLNFTTSNTFRESFVRKNLTFLTLIDENKERRILRILNKNKGPAIVYVRSRLRAEELAKYFNKNNLPSLFYHAGMEHAIREKNQEEWMKETYRIMVATSAFGMGIDKSNVRMVLHADLPENLESYYQEAGRAGRDKQKAYSILIGHAADIKNLTERIHAQYPEINFVKRVYQSLANYLKLAVGSNELISYDFDVDDFATTYNLKKGPLHYALKVLEKEGFIQLSEGFHFPSKIHFKITGESLYGFQVANKHLDSFVKTLLRITGGEVFSNFISISEKYIAKAAGLNVEEIKKNLWTLHKKEVLVYQPQKEKPQLTYLTPRLDAANLPIDAKRITDRKNKEEEKMNSMIRYTLQKKVCRVRFVVNYFGEELNQDCGNCDICLNKNKTDSNVTEQWVKEVLASGVREVQEISDLLTLHQQDQIIEILRNMSDRRIITIDQNGKITLI